MDTPRRLGVFYHYSVPIASGVFYSSHNQNISSLHFLPYLHTTNAALEDRNCIWTTEEIRTELDNKP
jgi:hypothetical protein